MNSGQRKPASQLRRRQDATPGETRLRYVRPEDFESGGDEQVEQASSQVASAFSQSNAVQAPASQIPTPSQPAFDETAPSEPIRSEPHAASGQADNAHAFRTVRPDAPTEHSALRTTGLVKSYSKGKHKVEVLRGVDMDVPVGDFTVILGQSGSGKSTLLHLLGTLDAPDEGEIYFNEKRIDNLPSSQQERLRNSQFGMIFQFYHLLPELTMLENVLVPKMIADGAMRYWFNRRAYTERAKHLLDMVGLSHRLRHKPNQLSGGEMQRTAIARALLTDPELLLADEPTGNLDEKTGGEILDIMHGLREDHDLTIVMVTHDKSIAETADHVITLKLGQVAG